MLSTCRRNFNILKPGDGATERRHSVARSPAGRGASIHKAKQFDVSRNHLTKATAAPAAAGFVETRRGAGGCTVLALPAEPLRLGEIIAALARGTVLMECFAPKGGACVITPLYNLKGIHAGAVSHFVEAFDSYLLVGRALPPSRESRLATSIEQMRTRAGSAVLRYGFRPVILYGTVSAALATV